MLLAELAAASAALGATRSRREKLEVLVRALRLLGPEELGIGVNYLAGRLPHAPTGIGPAAVHRGMGTAPASRPTLSLAGVDAALSGLAALRGAGSISRREARLAELFARATLPEQRFLARLLLGELRQGALEGIMVEAVAAAADLPPEAVRRAHMVCGALAPVARAALSEGAPGLERFRIELFRPVRPMLAQTAVGVAEALERLGRAAFEYKLDGARVQVHKAGAQVRVYTRALNEVTGAVPEIVAAVQCLPVPSLILDGEALAFRPDGTPQPFQITMRRFGRRQAAARLQRELPLQACFFDVLHCAGEDLTGVPGAARWDALCSALPPELRIPRRIAGAPEEAQAFLEEALERGHEGLMAKSLDAAYEAGNRGSGWLKIKPVHTLDLVVLAAEWGSGRRRGLLSNLHLGARDPQQGGFVMLGKTFKGMTDAMLEWQTDAFQAIATRREGNRVHLRPEIVVEIAFDGIQASPRYPGGLALRFARVKRYRPDKRPEEADTIASVRRLHRGGRAAD